VISHVHRTCAICLDTIRAGAAHEDHGGDAVCVDCAPPFAEGVRIIGRPAGERARDTFDRLKRAVFDVPEARPLWRPLRLRQLAHERAVRSRATAERLLGALGYVVAVDEDRVRQAGQIVYAPTAPHFLWHELGHALTYLGDPKPRTPDADWYPLPAWVERLKLPEQEADRLADVFAAEAAAVSRVRGVAWPDPAPRIPDAVYRRVMQRIRRLVRHGF
jgi:hypothetical protein